MNYFLSARAWRRLERRALRGHDRDLQTHLIELAQTEPDVVEVDASSAPGAVLIRFASHRLVLVGVSIATAAAAAGLTQSGFEVRLAKGGRYGSHWWVALSSATGEQVTILGARLRLTHDRGPRRHSDTAQPVDRQPALSS